MSNTIQRVCEYLRANDVHEDGLEVELADELEELGELIFTALRESSELSRLGQSKVGLSQSSEDQLSELL